MRQMSFRLCLGILLGFMAAHPALAEKGPFAATAMQTFADVLKIPLAAPGVNVRVSGTTEEDGLITEDISWKSLDGEEPFAFVIRPAKVKGPLPAIVCLHGSHGSRESMTTRQFGFGDWTTPGDKAPHKRLIGWARELSRRGYLTLALTQRGLDRRKPRTEDQTKYLLLHGRVLMGAIVYEIRQAVTYLSSRSDVDPERIGMTGLSFGGITTFYTWLVDDRIRAAAPVCGGIGSLETLAQKGSRSYHGVYFWIPGMLQKGDQGDFAAAMAPRPFMLWAPTEDIGMPNEGVDRFVEAVKPAYARAGASDALVIHRRPGIHEFSLEAFDAVATFLGRHLRKE